MPLPSLRLIGRVERGDRRLLSLDVAERQEAPKIEHEERGEQRGDHCNDDDFSGFHGSSWSMVILVFLPAPIRGRAQLCKRCSSLPKCASSSDGCDYGFIRRHRGAG